MKRFAFFRPGTLIAGVALSLTGCAVGPDYKRPDVATPDHWQSLTQFRQAQPADSRQRDAWWEMFGDDALNQLEKKALDHNQELVVAAEHLNQARLQVNATASVQLPSVDAYVSDARFKTSADRPLATYTTPNFSVVQNNPQLGFTVNYEADVFGRVRRLVEGAQAAADQAAADFENTKLLLTTDLAADYLNLRESDQEIDILQNNVRLQDKALEFIRSRHDLNYATGLDLAQQQALLESSQTQLALLRNQRVALQYAIATLTGTPAPEFELAVQSHSIEVPNLPVGLPSELLQRRPDIASAERAVAQANAAIGLAKTAYFPSVMLQAGGGWDSNKWSNLVSAPSIMWALGVAATEHLFDNGKTTANVNMAESAYAGAVANYRQHVLVAMQEVQTGIDGTIWLNSAHANARAAVASAEKAFSIANDRYAGGLDIYLNVITTQQTLLANQRQASQIDGQQLLNAVYLVKAMGGGWQGLPQ